MFSFFASFFTMNGGRILGHYRVREVIKKDAEMIGQMDGKISYPDAARSEKNEVKGGGQSFVLLERIQI